MLDVPGQEIAAVRRSWNGESIVIVYNYSDESASVELPGVSGMELRGYLTVSSAQEVSLGEQLEMPAFSIAFLTEK